MSRIVSLVKKIDTEFTAQADEIEKLDQVLGDGDHLETIKRGLATIVSMEAELAEKTEQEALQAIGMKLLGGLGGAAGPLLGSTLLGMSTAVDKDASIDVPTFAKMFAAGVEAMKKRGKSDAGQKTMLDVLVPVSAKFTALCEEGADKATLLQALSQEAEKGMLSTKDMLSTIGRSARLGERSLGHVDPGAKSCQVIISTICANL